MVCMMLAQDIGYCAKYFPHKHAVLGIAIHHMTRSNLLITILDRMGHCVSYNDVQVMNTNLAKYILAKWWFHQTLALVSLSKLQRTITTSTKRFLLASFVQHPCRLSTPITQKFRKKHSAVTNVLGQVKTEWFT